MNKIFLDSSTKYKGSFLCWHWEQWAIGGGGGLVWFFFSKEINPGRYNPLWIIYYLQRGNH